MTIQSSRPKECRVILSFLFFSNGRKESVYFMRYGCDDVFRGKTIKPCKKTDAKSYLRIND